MSKSPPQSGRAKKFTAWVLQILVGTSFVAAGSAKLAGAPMMVEIFDHIGVGQWFRYLTGIVEVSSGIMLFIPKTACIGGALLSLTMDCAICVHLFRIGGNPAPAFILLVLSAAIIWLRRDESPSLFRRAVPSPSTSA
jgi:putative oxidoreductase